MTRIFSVEYWMDEFYNGSSPTNYKSKFSVVAKDGQDAIGKVKAKAMKPFSYVNDEKKKVTVTKKNFSVVDVTLLAETD